MAGSLERFQQMARMVALLEILQQSRFGQTLAELRDALVDRLGIDDCSTKSVSRYLQFWQQAGFEMLRETRPGPPRQTIWRLARAEAKLPRLDVTVHELLAFSAGRELMASLAGTPYWDAIQSLWGKMRAVLPAEVWQAFERARPGLLVRGPAAKRYLRKEGQLSALHRALAEHRVARIAYAGRVGKVPAERDIEPHAVVLYEGSLYVAAYDRGVADGPAKLFKADRIERAEALDVRFRRRRSFDPQSLFSSAIGIYRGGAAQRFRIRIAPPCARWALERPFHPRQTAHPQADGSVLLDIDEAHEAEILTRVLPLGADAEVLEPASCRAKLRDIAAALLARYQEKPAGAR